MRNHGIKFENCENSWANGLPLGNGVFGSMVYYKDKRLFMPLNHYEVYYNNSQTVLPADQLAALKDAQNPGEDLAKRKELAEFNLPKDNGLFSMYNVRRGGASYSMGAFTGSHPQTGDLSYTFCDCIKYASTLLSLDVESAKVTFTAKDDKNKLEMSTIFAREDCVITKVQQSKHGIVKALNLSLFPARDADMPDVEYYSVSDTVFGWRASLKLAGANPDHKPFVYSGTVKLVDAAAKLVLGENEATLELNGEKEFTVITTVTTDWRYENPKAAGIENIEDYAKNIDSLYKEHAEYWADFWSHCSIELPDKFIERVWYINQYALESCSGRDGIMKHHACGLNGLWDVKRPTLWGSLWYWDVNIQASFAGVFSSNHMHLGKVFSDGLNTYTDLARKWAKNKHGKNGIAFDYPYFCYFSVWPWCAQYLWNQYEYTQDVEYLKNEAYPLFLGMCEFAVELYEFDEETGRYFVFPDISPEQGPLSHNTVITVAATKSFLKFSLEAAKILGDQSELIEKVRHLYEHMPLYPTTEEGAFGKRYLDGVEAPPNLWIRHPGILMPCFPTGEIGMLADCTDEEMQIISNSISYLEERCEVGVFQSSWLAASAARLGQGQRAIRLLYEKGMDHMLRSNGLCAEETDRFLNHCLTMRQPIYYPCMMEYTGEMLAALNEMLLQSFGNAINVFPALPDGDPEYHRAYNKGYSNEDFKVFTSQYDAWRDVRIDTMRACGAFLVSAKLSDGKLEFIKVDSLAGKPCRITSPYISKDMKVFSNGKQIEFTFDGDIICFDTTKETSYVIAVSDNAYTSPEYTENNSEVTYHLSAFKHHVYLGGNADTAYHKALDMFTRDFYYSHTRIPNRSVYRIDFGFIEDLKKNDNHYAKDLPKQYYWSDLDRGSNAMTFIRMHDPKARRDMDTFKHQSSSSGLPWYNNGQLYDPLFSIHQGFGLAHINDVNFVDHQGPDVLRRDFAEGCADNEFIIEAPAGEYEFFICSGDALEPSFTEFETDNGFKTVGKELKPGEWQCELIPVIANRDGNIRIKISTKAGFKWKLSYILVNKNRPLF